MKRPYDKRNRWMIDYVPVMPERKKIYWQDVLAGVVAGFAVCMMIVCVMYF